MGELLAFLASLCWTASNVAIARGAGGKGEDNGAFLSILLTAVVASLVWLAGTWDRGLPAMAPAGLAWFMVGGAMTGALTGVGLFLLSALWVPNYRTSVRSTFTRFNPWLLGAGLAASTGQLLFFVAIDHTTVSRAALIVSLEVFLTMGLTRLVLPGREPMSASTMIAAVLGVAGTVVIMLG